jgi:hypothetical protein
MPTNLWLDPGWRTRNSVVYPGVAVTHDTSPPSLPSGAIGSKVYPWAKDSRTRLLLDSKALWRNVRDRLPYVVARNRPGCRGSSGNQVWRRVKFRYSSLLAAGFAPCPIRVMMRNSFGSDAPTISSGLRHPPIPQDGQF